MKLLLDSQIFVWMFSGSSRLKPHLREFITDRKNSLFISIVTPWELQIKEQSGKFVVDGTIEGFMQLHCYPNDVAILPIQTNHIWTLKQLPLHHRDPFDRIMIAQAIAEGMIMVSADRTFPLYPVKLLN